MNEESDKVRKEEVRKKERKRKERQYYKFYGRRKEEMKQIGRKEGRQKWGTGAAYPRMRQQCVTCRSAGNLSGPAPVSSVSCSEPAV